MASAPYLRAGVIGLGWAGLEHLKSYLAMEETTLVAVSDSSVEAVDRAKSMFDVSQDFGDYRKMLEALGRGIHVLVEKPLARTYDEGLQMVRAAEKNNRVVKVMFNQRYRPDVTVVKRFIDSGDLGTIYHCKSRWLRRDGIPGRGRKWFVSKRLAGGGPLIDLGVHMLDMALYAMGEPVVEAVSGATYDALGTRFVTDLYGSESKYEVEDFATAMVRMGGGKTLLLEASWATYKEDGDLMNLMFYGDRGGAEMTTKRYNAADAVRFYVDAAGVPAEVIPEIPPPHTVVPGHQQAARLFVEHILSDNYKEHHGREGLLRTWIIDAIYRSAAEGREIRLEELQT